MSDRHRLMIFQDDRSFHDRTSQMLQRVHQQMDEDLKRFGFGQRSLFSQPASRSSAVEWDDPIDRLSKDFFQLRPASSSNSSSSGNGSRLTSPGRGDDFGSRENLDDDSSNRRYYLDAGPGSDAGGAATGGAGGRLFNMSFDVKDYDAEDISVTVEDDTLIVKAKHRSDVNGAVSVKEFSRKVKIPKDVDPEKLSSTLTSDGILTIEAPVPPPAYALQQSPVYDQQPSAPPVTGQNNDTGSMSAFRPYDGTEPPASSLISRAIPAGATTTASNPAPTDTPMFYTDRETGRRMMELQMEVGKPYTPEDIAVKLEGRRLIVEATHEEKFQGRSSRVSMNRDFDLVEDIDVSTVQALMKVNGILSITAYVQ